MSDDGIPKLDIVIQGLQDVIKLQKALLESADNANRLEGGMSGVVQSVKEAAAAMRELQSLTKGVQSGYSLKTIFGNIGQGGPLTAFSLSQYRGEISKIKAEYGQFGADSINTTYNEMQKIIASRGKTLFVSMAKSIQTTASSSQDQLALQIKAQEFRYSQALLEHAKLSGSEADTFKVETLEKEKAAYDSLLVAQAAIKKADKDRLAVINETDAALQKLFKAQAVGDAAAIKAAKEKLAIQADVNRTAAKQQAAANKQFSQYLQPAAKTPLTPSESIDNRLADPNYLASLFKIQAALLGNYLLMTQIFKLFSFGAGFVKDFDAALVSMQAIGSFTNTQMKDLKDTIVDIGDASKFTTVEIAKAGEEMAKAGFNAEQIKTSLKAVTQLAAATGVPLVDATKDVVTVIDTFKMSADETTHITNALAGALNSTKLEAEGFSSGLAQSGNIAQEAGVSFEELTAVMAALANAGVKSQIIGSGLRTVITSLENPNAKLLKQLHEVGLTSDDVNIKTHGLIGALQNLTKAGFGSEGAFAAFNARGASAFLAIQNNIGTAGDLEKQIVAGNAAAKASDTQMKSLASSATALENSLGALIDKGFTPIKDILIDAAGAGATFLDFLNKSTAVVPILAEILGSTVAVFSTAFVGKQVLNIGKGLVGLIDFGGMAAGAKLVTASVTELGAAIFGAETAAVGLSGAFAGAAAIVASVTLPGWVAWAAIIATVAFGLDHLHRALSDAETATENLNTKMNTQKDALVKANEQIQSYGNEITNLQTKYGYLSSHHDALETELERLKQRFPQLGDAVLSAVDPVNKLIDRLKELQKQSEASKFSALEAILDASKQQEKSTITDLSKQMRGVKQFSFVDHVMSQPGFNDNSFIDQLKVGQAGLYDSLSGSSLSGIDPKVAQLIQGIHSTVSGPLANRLDMLDVIKGDPGSAASLNYNNELFGNPDNPKASSVKGDIAAMQKSVDDALSAADLKLKNVTDETERSSIEKSMGRDQLEKIKTTLQGFQDKLATLPAQAAVQISAMTQLIDEGSKNVNSHALGHLDIASQLEDLPIKIRDAEKAYNSAASQKDTAGEEKAFGSLVQYKHNLDNLLADLVDKDVSGFLKAVIASRIAKNDNIDQNLAKAKLERMIAGAQTTVSELGDSIAKKSEELINNLSQLMKQTNDALEKLNQKLETDQLYNNQQIAEIDASIAANADHNSPNFGKVTGGTIATLEASKRELGLDNLRIEKASLTQQLGDISSGESNAIRARDNLSGYASASPDSEEYKAYEKAQADVIKLEKDRITTVAKLNQVTATLDYQTGSLTAKNESYADTVQHAITYSNQQAMAANDLGTALRDNVIKTMDTARTSFAGFLKDWLTGTKSMGDAAKQLGKTILEEILNKMTMSASTNLIDMGSKLGGSALSSGLGWLLGGLSHFNTGGMPYKRAATGMSTRDSVPILARPGEYILRESAVGMIGKDNLDYINAMGNSRLSQSQSNMRMPAPQKTELNVYVVSPQAQPTLTKNDVIATITDDMARGGATKKLVKSISVGAM